MEDWLKCQIGTLVKYRQNRKNKTNSNPTISRFMWKFIQKDKILTFILSGCD